MKKNDDYYYNLIKKIDKGLRADGFINGLTTWSVSNNRLEYNYNKNKCIKINNLNKKSDEEIAYKLGKELSVKTNINESLKKEENRKRFRELVMKYHPDKGGNNEMMARINASKTSDEVFERLYRELSGKITAKGSEKKIMNMAEYEKVFEAINVWLEREGRSPVFFIVFSDGRVKFNHDDRTFTMFHIDKFENKEELAKEAYKRICEEFFKRKS